jgi:hypothetical protein
MTVRSPDTGPSCYRAEDALKAFPLGGGKARARSQVIIDDLDLLPAQRTHPFGHRILEELPFFYSAVLVCRWIDAGNLSELALQGRGDRGRHGLRARARSQSPL